MPGAGTAACRGTPWTAMRPAVTLTSLPRIASTSPSRSRKAKPVYFPEAGTDLEKVAMALSRAEISRHLPAGRQVRHRVRTASAPTGPFRQPSAPYNEPCIDDEGDVFIAGEDGQFFGSTATSKFNAESPVRCGQPPNLQGRQPPDRRGLQQGGLPLPAAAHHRPVGGRGRPSTTAPSRPSRWSCGSTPLTAPSTCTPTWCPTSSSWTTTRCGTPTDIIGQHIHLPKWDLTTTDGAANGWNYEDGTLSPGAVLERIDAINHWNENTDNSLY